MRLTKKIIITGHAEHGKDTACDFLLKKFGITSRSSSMAACELFIYEKLKAQFGYGSIEECFIDRRNHRSLWCRMISEYNHAKGMDSLGRHIFAEFDCYNGIRRLDELQAIKNNNLADYLIWIDASQRLPLESLESMNIPITEASMVISNNGTKADFYKKLENVGELLLGCKDF